MTRFLSLDELSFLRSRLSSVVNEIDREKIIQSTVYPAEFDIDVLNELREFITEKIFSQHPHLTYDFLKKNFELFNLENFKESVFPNIPLILNTQFIEENNISVQDQVEYILKARKIPAEIFQNIEETLPVEVISAIISRAEVSKTPFAAQKLEELIEKYGEKLCSAQLLKMKPNLSFKTETILETAKTSTTFNLEEYIVFAKALSKYPNEFEVFLNHVDDRFSKGDFISGETNTSLTGLGPVNIMNKCRFIEQLNKFSSQYVIGQQNFIAQTLMSHHVPEEAAFHIIEPIINCFGYEGAIIWARNNKYNSILLNLSLRDVPEEDDEEY